MSAPCRYCQRIRAHAPRYRVRRARHALDGPFPRCDFHWRFRCALCRRDRAFHAVAFCPRREAFLCLDCAPAYRAPGRPFWGWTYHYRLRCPWRKEWHVGLDRLEYDGKHPWQVRPAWRRARRGMTTEEAIPPPWTFGVRPLDGVTDADVRAGWDAVATWWTDRYGPRGDLNREYVIDPVLLALLGDVGGQRVLDAGCGSGYLARILARQGAEVTGIDLSPRLLAAARAAEAREPLGIRYREGDLADLTAFPSVAFDAAVANVVLQDVRRYREAIGEIGRVLRPGGRFVFSITHPAYEAPVPGQWVREPPDTERPEERPHLAADRYFDRVAVSWAPPGLPPVVGFHRPLRDYAEALHDAGLLVRRLEEPRPTAAGLERHYRQLADLLRLPLFLVVEAVKPPAPRPPRPRGGRRSGPRPP